MQLLKTVAIAIGLMAVTPAIAKEQGSVLGIMPGMTLEAVDAIVAEQGFVKLEDNRGQGENPTYIANYGRLPDGMSFSVEMRTQGDHSRVFRTNLILPLAEDNPSAELVKEMTVKYQTGMTCQDYAFEFHFDADWQSTDAGRCGLKPVIPFDTLNDESLSFFSQPQEWRYTTVVGKFDDAEGEPRLFITVQDNLEAARVRLSQLSWDTAVAPVTDSARIEAKPQAPAPELSPAPLPVKSEPVDQKREEFLPGTFHIRDIHGVSLLMMRETAIQALLDSGFKTQKPPYAIQPRNIVKSEAGVEYAVFRDNNSHDKYAYREERWFKRGPITVQLTIFPTQEGWKIGKIERIEELDQPIFEQAALQQLTGRAGSLQPHCAERDYYNLRMGWAMNSDWSVLKSAKKGGYCLSPPQENIHRPSRAMEDYTKGFRGSIQFLATLNNAGGETTSKLTFNLVASEFIVKSADYALRKSEEIRAEKAATQTISDF